MKNHIINEIIRVEGGYVNDPNDSGGETNFGITAKVARANGYAGRMDCMPREVAFDIYAAKYWDAVKADDLVALSESVAAEVVDTSVNMGPGRAGMFLQRALNVLNSKGKLYPDLEVDGAIGLVTVSALRGYLTERDEDTLVKALNCLQGAYYVNLAERREKDETFVYGWFKNRVKL
jgi:Putative secretion activating protein